MRKEDSDLEIFKKHYEEVSYMMSWYGHDGSDARLICTTIENLIKNFGYDISKLDWIVK